MSIMEYDTSRRCLSHNISYPNYMYNERNVPMALAHNTRGNPRGYPVGPVGGPVGGMHNRANMGREEPVMETGPARRRIAVACARCRKRKIRCSGDPGNGSGCVNCRQAGIDPVHCQFHRVGSDHVSKVIDNINMAHSLSGMANSHNIMSIYTAGGNNTLYPRPVSAQQYSQLDTKSVYPSGWTVPYSEDTSPVDTYNLDQPTAYLPNPTPMPTTNVYGPSCRWTHPIAKPLHHGNTYFDSDSSYNGLPYSHSNGRLTTASDGISPLNTGMSSLNLSLPERPHPRQHHPLESNVPQRQLPMPQPSPAQNSRNIVDQLQDARLRSTHGIGASTLDNRSSFAKPLIPWSADAENHINVTEATASDNAAQVMAPTQLPDNTDGAMSYLPATTSMTDDTIATSTASQLQLNFSTAGLLDSMNVSAPANTYSFLRESRPSRTSPSQMPRQSSQSDLYSYNTGNTSKRNSFGGESSNESTLVSGHRYTPLSHSQSQSSPGSHNMHRESCQSRNVQLHRASMSNLNSSY